MKKLSLLSSFWTWYHAAETIVPAGPVQEFGADRLSLPGDGESQYYRRQFPADKRRCEVIFGGTFGST
jgi:hypothetical protein